MSLGCNLKEVKQNAFSGIQKLVKTKTISMNDDGLIKFEYSKSDKYKTREAAYNVALSVQNKIKDFISKQIGPKFTENWTSLNQKENEITLQYSFPKYVERAYNRKFTIEEGRQAITNEVNEARKQHIEDAERAGIDMSEFSDDYLYFQYEDDFDSFMDPDKQYKLENSVPDDFSSYFKHKTNLLKKLEDKFESYKTLNKKNYDSEKYKKDVYNFQNTITKLKDEIESLNQDDVNVVFQDVINEMNYLDSLLNTNDVEILGNQDVINRIDLLSQMITGQNLNGELINYDTWSGDSFMNYDSIIVAGITKLTNKLKNKQQQIIKDLLSKDVIFQANKDNFTEEEIQSLFDKMSDINFLQEYFLGINSNNDTIAATLLNTTFQTNVQKTKQFAKPLIDKILSMDKRLKEKNFNLNTFFETDNKGIDTGNIIHKYTKDYFKKLYDYFELNKEFNQAKKEKKPLAYAKKIAWLKENTDVIDFRKLKSFKDLYNDQYSDFFTNTDEEMQAYEDKMKQSLGKMYDYHIEDLQKKLAEYEQYKTAEELKQSKWLSKNINSNSPWIFIQNYYSDSANEQVEYESGMNTYFTFNNSKFIEYVPKKEKYNVDTGNMESTGFFNEKFDSIEQEPDAFEYWEAIREIYSKHINPTYSSMGQNISSLSWAKFEKTFAEEMIASKGIKGFFKNLYNEAIKTIKQTFYEKGYFTDASGIKSNYTDATSSQISKFKKLLHLKNISQLQEEATKEGIEFSDLSKLTKDLKTSEVNATTEAYKNDLVDKIARKKVLSDYSRDLTKTTTALAELATLHKSRQETQFIADMLLNYHKSIKDKKSVNGKHLERHRSNDKLQSWVSTNIYNQRAVSRGNAQDGLGVENKQRFWKYYSDTEKQLMDLLKSLNSDSTSNVANFNFFKDGINYSKKGNDYYETIEGKPSKINKDVFESALTDYINIEENKLGIPLTPGGVGLGIMKAIISKSLALNPVSGIFNRVDGLFANTIRDNMGDYWTSGNMKYAKRFMALANINKFAGDKMSLQNKQKASQMKTFQSLLDNLSLFQDKKNELDRKDKESKFNSWKEKFNIFQFAVDNPEFKNQGEIVLSMLMDVKIKDIDGKEYKFFDGSGFPAYKAGTTELNDNFKTEENQGWEDFSINVENPSFNQFFAQKIKIEDTIKRTQGNYASLDSIKISDDNWGKFLMLFMRWMPEHVNQRFGTRSIDIIQGKKKIAGRYRGLVRNAGATGIFSSIVLGIGFGPVGAIAGLSAAIIPFVIQKFYSKYVYGEKDIQNHLLDMHVTIGFMKEILIQSMNLPMKMTYTKGNLDSIIKNQRLDHNKNSNLSEDEARALKGMAQEVAIMLTQLVTLIMLKSLLWDNDDDEEDHRRQLHNFIDNQANRSIGNMTNWSNPSKFIEENSKLAMLRYLADIGKLLKHTHDYYVKEKGTATDLLFDFTKVQPIIPIPNSLSKGVLKNEYPGLDKKEYQGSQWFDDYVKGSEYMANKVLKNRRSEFKQEYEEMLRQKYEGKDIEEDKLDKLIDKKTRRRMNKKDIQKKKNETAEEALERIDFEEKKENLKKK